MKTLKFAALAILPALFVATPAQAGEVFGGLYVHDVDTFLTIAGVEDGMDVQLGWRGDRIGKTPLQPYAFAAVNTSGNTNYAAVGLSAKFGKQFFVRPGLGIAVHTGSTKGYQIDGNGKLEFGSRVLFEPELGIGAQITDRTSIEASWVHMSHATLFSKQNPGSTTWAFD
ncbi:acyloxyacyl hydrolase [Sphingomonas daechungensis]|uniref:Acyloxyacyl hydrolase n=1 Tax=Sphingomonas daechungensis TaxID=1176646 RepID=A0ABX6T256_9SPHN|nr:acyloxyacyl hydrolase [Sphingomonas daechungensis]QNP43942.1 acyloxyacyl hydrolase [Sphingomonas daechungensis]